MFGISDCAGHCATEESGETGLWGQLMLASSSSSSTQWQPAHHHTPPGIIALQQVNQLSLPQRTAAWAGGRKPEFRK